MFGFTRSVDPALRHLCLIGKVSSRVLTPLGRVPLGLGSQESAQGQSLRAYRGQSPLSQETSCCSVAKSCPTLCDPWTAARQAPLSFTVSWRLLKFVSVELEMLSNHLIFFFRLFLLPSVFSSESDLLIKTQTGSRKWRPGAKETSSGWRVEGCSGSGLRGPGCSQIGRAHV